MSLRVDILQRERKLVQFWEREIRDSVAWHGTSLETIQTLLETGIIPGYSGKPERRSLRVNHDLYFMANGARFPFNKIQGPNTQLIEGVKQYSPEQALHTVTGYAKQIAERHYLYAHLGVPLSTSSADTDVLAFFSDLENGYPIEECEGYEDVLELASSKISLSQVIPGARDRHGVIIGLLADTFNTFPPKHGDFEDLKINPESGLAIDFISGLQPLGAAEERFFRELKMRSSDLENLI